MDGFSALALAVAVLSSFFFFLSSFWSGLVIEFSSFSISITNPLRPIVICGLSLLVYFATRRAHFGAECVTELQTRNELSTLAIKTGLFLLASWLTIRTSYRIHNLPQFIPAAIIMHGAAWLGGTGLLRGGSASLSRYAAGIGSLFWVVSPLGIPVSWPAALVYTLLAPLAWLPVDRIRGGNWPIRGTWIAAILLFALGLIITTSLDQGWATGRLRNNLSQITNQGIWLIPALHGVFCMRNRGALLKAHLVTALIIGALFLGGAGARGAWGSAAAAGLVPALSWLIGASSGSLIDWLRSKGRIAAGNVLLLIALALFFSWFRFGNQRPYTDNLHKAAWTHLEETADPP
jgi:hypothetical protein